MTDTQQLKNDLADALTKAASDLREGKIELAELRKKLANTILALPGWACIAEVNDLLYEPESSEIPEMKK